jgi:hypothetical protein
MPAMRISGVEEVESTPLEISHRRHDRTSGTRLRRPHQGAGGACKNSFPQDHDAVVLQTSRREDAGTRMAPATGGACLLT